MNEGWISIYLLLSCGPKQCQKGKGSVSLHAECRGKHLPRGWSLLPHMLPAKRGELKVGNDKHVFLLCQRKFQVSAKCVELHENISTFALEACSLHEEVCSFLVLFNLSESYCAWSEPSFLDSCGNRGGFACHFLRVEILLWGFFGAFLSNCLRAGHLVINIIVHFIWVNFSLQRNLSYIHELSGNTFPIQTT